MRAMAERVLRRLEDRFARDVLRAGGYSLDSPSLSLGGRCLGDLLRQPLQLEPLEVSLPLPPNPDRREFTLAAYYPVCPQFVAPAASLLSTT